MGRVCGGSGGGDEQGTGRRGEGRREGWFGKGAGRCLVWAILDWSKLSPAQELRAEPARLSF